MCADICLISIEGCFLSGWACLKHPKKCVLSLLDYWLEKNFLNVEYPPEAFWQHDKLNFSPNSLASKIISCKMPKVIRRYGSWLYTCYEVEGRWSGWQLHQSSHLDSPSLPVNSQRDPLSLWEKWLGLNSWKFTGWHTAMHTEVFINRQTRREREEKVL